MPIGHAFIELGSVDSTNNYAMGRVHAGSAFHGTIFFAHDQWAGKGQRGRIWNSRPGENIVMSVVLEPAFLPVACQFSLNAAVALACHDLLESWTGMEELSIKWPNDLYWRDRKAGGILIENVLRGNEWLFSVAGIGINLNQTVFPETLRNPVSLKQITGRSFDAVDMAKKLGGSLERRFEWLRRKWQGADAGEGADAGAVMEEYNNRLYCRRRQVILKSGAVEASHLIVGVTGSGELVTRDPKDKEYVFRFGEVEWVPDR